MNIGFVSTWFERGAAYVTKQYINLLKENHNVFVYARGGERYGKGDENWDFHYVTWSPRLLNSNINYNHLKRWIQKNNIETIFFNEQIEIDIVYKVKKYFPEIKLGSYIDYYKDNTVKEFMLYDFLICNTKRHHFAFKDHPQAYYVPWGTDNNLFRPQEKKNNEITFFHSSGMAVRKGTNFVIDAFIKGKLYEKSKLIIHTQRNLETTFGYTHRYLSKYNIEVIEETVSAPGLYHLGDVYVYPTMLDGLGLSMYEALSCGLAVIATDHPPMNEVINNEVGSLVDVEYLKSRADGYFWPLSIVCQESLEKSMRYFIDNPDILQKKKEEARKQALTKWNWDEREAKVNRIFVESKIRVSEPSKEFIAQVSMYEKLRRKIGSSYLYSIFKKII